MTFFARRVVGWAAGDRLRIRNWRCWPYAGPSPCGVHPSGSFTTRTVAANTAPSSTRLELRKERHLDLDVRARGNCFDNAMVETFFKTLKTELVWRTIFQSRIEAAIAIGRYIDGFYNVSSEHTSRYVVDAKRLCWATSCSAGCFEDLERTARRA